MHLSSHDCTSIAAFITLSFIKMAICPSSRERFTDCYIMVPACPFSNNGQYISRSFFTRSLRAPRESNARFCASVCRTDVAAHGPLFPYRFDQVAVGLSKDAVRGMS